MSIKTTQSLLWYAINSLFYFTEYVNDHDEWVVHGSWNITMEEKLTKKLKELRTDKTRRNEEELAHCQKEMEQLTEQSREADDKTTQELTEQVQQPLATVYR